MGRHPISSLICAAPLLLLLLIAGLLFGCATASTPSTNTVVKVICPPISSYTPHQQKALAAAMRGLSPDNPLNGAMADYHKLRDALRACAAS